MDRQEEVLICAESVPDTRGKEMGPKLVNGCRPEQLGTKEFGKMMRRIQTLEEGRLPAKEAKNWRIEGEKNYEKGVSEAVKQF